MKLPYLSTKFKKPNINAQKLLGSFVQRRGKTAWGIDIGGHALKAVKLTQVAGSVFIDDVDIIEYPVLSSNVNFLQSAHVKEAIQTLIARHHITHACNVSISIPGQVVLSRFTIIPPVNKKQLKALVQYEAKQQIPFDLKEIIWDYQQLSDFVTNTEGIEIGLFASKKVTLDHILINTAALKHAIRTLQISPLALYNFALFDRQIDSSAIILNVETENTDLVIADGARLWLRSIPLSTINTDLIKEIQRSMEYYKSLVKDTVNFKTILLVGDTFKDIRHVRFITDSFKYEARVLNAFNNIKLSDKVSDSGVREGLLNLGVALGLALQSAGLGRIKTNLLPPELIKAAEISKKKPYAIAGLGCLALSLVVQYRGLHTQTIFLNNSHECHQRVLQNLKDLEKKYKGAENQAQIAKLTLNLVSSIDSSRFFWMEALSKLLSAMPDNVLITSIQTSWIDANAIKTEGTAKQTPGFFQNKKANPQTKPSTPQKLLLMGMKGESNDPRMGFIEEQILKPIRNLTLFDQKVTAFKNVEIVPGSCRQIGQKDEMGSYISFELRWVVKSREEVQSETDSLLLTKGTSTVSVKL